MKVQCTSALAALVLTTALCTATSVAAQAPIVRVPPPAEDNVAPPPPPPSGVPSSASEPPGTAEALSQLTSQPFTHTAFTFDRDMLQSVLGTQSAGLNSITVQSYRFKSPAFYVPEELSALSAAYGQAGWKHLVEAHVPPREQALPVKPITDLWLHYRGTEIDDVAVLIRAPKQMNVIEVSGVLRPLDLAHLGGHFGLPRVDPDTVMVPAQPGR